MIICILSDSHDRREYLVAAVGQAKEAGAAAILHCGDVVSPWVLAAVQPFGLPLHVIHGNNAGDLVMLTRMANRRGSLIHYHGQDADFELAGRRIFLVHFPHYARGMAAVGDWDLVCCGHSHKVEISAQTNCKGGITHLVNPGTIGGVGQAPATWIFADLVSMTFELHNVPKSLEYRDTGTAGHV